MKIAHKLFVPALLALGCSSAFAGTESGKISFTGQASAGTCEVAVVDTGNNNGSGAKSYSRDGVVVLPTINLTKDTVAVVSTSAPGVGAEKFQIKMDCGSTTPTNPDATLALYSPLQDVQGVLDNNYQGNATGATGIAIAIHKADGSSTNQVKVGSDNMTSQFDGNNVALFELQASYVLADNAASATPGLVDTLTQYTVEYN